MTQQTHIPQFNSAYIHNDELTMAKMAISFANMYKDPMTATMREYITNALDAHRAAGITDPIEVTLPTNTSPILTITDHGTGIDKETMSHYVLAYGDSTKRHDLNQTGEYGYGSKAGLSIGDTVTFVSTKDETTTTGILLFDHTIERIQTSILSSVTVPGAPNGTTVSVTLSEERANAYRIFENFLSRFYTIVSTLPTGSVRITNDRDNTLDYNYDQRELPLLKTTEGYSNYEWVDNDDLKPLIITDRVGIYKGNDRYQGPPFRPANKTDKIEKHQSYDIRYEAKYTNCTVVVGGVGYESDDLINKALEHIDSKSNTDNTTSLYELLFSKTALHLLSQFNLVVTLDKDQVDIPENRDHLIASPRTLEAFINEIDRAIQPLETLYHDWTKGYTTYQLIKGFNTLLEPHPNTELFPSLWYDKEITGSPKGSHPFRHHIGEYHYIRSNYLIEAEYYAGSEEAELFIHPETASDDVLDLTDNITEDGDYKPYQVTELDVNLYQEYIRKVNKNNRYGGKSPEIVPTIINDRLVLVRHTHLGHFVPNYLALERHIENRTWALSLKEKRRNQPRSSAPTYILTHIEETTVEKGIGLGLTVTNYGRKNEATIHSFIHVNTEFNRAGNFSNQERKKIKNWMVNKEAELQEKTQAAGLVPDDHTIHHRITILFSETPQNLILEYNDYLETYTLGHFLSEADAQFRAHQAELRRIRKAEKEAAAAALTAKTGDDDEADDESTSGGTLVSYSKKITYTHPITGEELSGMVRVNTKSAAYTDRTQWLTVFYWRNLSDEQRCAIEELGIDTKVNVHNIPVDTIVAITRILRDDALPEGLSYDALYDPEAYTTRNFRQDAEGSIFKNNRALIINKRNVEELNNELPTLSVLGADLDQTIMVTSFNATLAQTVSRRAGVRFADLNLTSGSYWNNRSCDDMPTPEFYRTMETLNDIITFDNISNAQTINKYVEAWAEELLNNDPDLTEADLPPAITYWRNLVKNICDYVNSGHIPPLEHNYRITPGEINLNHIRTHDVSRLMKSTQYYKTIDEARALQPGTYRSGSNGANTTFGYYLSGLSLHAATEHKSYFDSTNRMTRLMSHANYMPVSVILTDIMGMPQSLLEKLFSISKD